MDPNDEANINKKLVLEGHKAYNQETYLKPEKDEIGAILEN